jgi:hypothetical protein
MAANAPLIGIHGHSTFFVGNNHHSKDLKSTVGYAASIRLNAERFGIHIQYAQHNNELKPDAVLIVNTPHVNNKNLMLSIGYNLFNEFDLFEPRISIGGIYSRYRKDFKTNQNYMGLGLKYARCVCKGGVFLSFSSDLFFNISNNINAPAGYTRYMNQKIGLMLNVGIEYRLFKNS